MLKRLLSLISKPTTLQRRLVMNNIIDISDRSPGSHLELFNYIHPEQIIEALSIKKIGKITVNTTIFDDIVEKMK